MDSQPDTTSPMASSTVMTVPRKRYESTVKHYETQLQQMDRKLEIFKFERMDQLQVFKDRIADQISRFEIENASKREYIESQLALYKRVNQPK
jgi:hypothetical protein